jgi:hypothetical protein
MWEGRRVRLPPHRSFRDARSCLPCLRTHHSTPLSPAPMDCSAGAMCSYSCASGGRKRAARGASVITAAPPATVLEVSLELQRESVARPVRERGQLSARAKDRSASCEWAVGARRLTLVLRHGYWYAAAAAAASVAATKRGQSSLMPQARGNTDDRRGNTGASTSSAAGANTRVGKVGGNGPVEDADRFGPAQGDRPRLRGLNKSR